MASLVRRATDRRRHFRVVIGSFVDLVVLSLAGGVGIDGALHTASQVSPDWAAQRIGADAAGGPGQSAMPRGRALDALGRELDVAELVELATTVQLAGTEGARISAVADGPVRIAAPARAGRRRVGGQRHDRAPLPARALLLLGFLVFIGYPAFQRILGGF